MRFHRIIQTARMPMAADPSALGTVPTRAFRYCEALRAYSSFGAYMFPPMGFSVVLQDDDLYWAPLGSEDWQLMRYVYTPDLPEQFKAGAPEECSHAVPAVLTKLPEPGTFQIWTGMLVSTPPDTSLIVRPPVNVPNPGGYVLYEGIVESDRWFGPLFTNARLTRTGVPVHFEPDFPLVQVQQVPRSVYQAKPVIELFPEISDMAQAEWDAYFVTVVEPNLRKDRPFGEYARASRKRADAPVPA